MIDEELVEVVETGSHDEGGGGEETDGEEECLLTVNENGETPSGRPRKNTSVYNLLSNNPLQLLILVWIVSAVLFYQLGQWKCKRSSQVQSSLPNGSFQPQASTVQPTLVNETILVGEDEFSTEEKKNEIITETSASAPDEIEPSLLELEDDEPLEIDATASPDTENALFFPHLPYGDGRKNYRRVCAPVHSSELCLTLRFPFAVETQDPHLDYPHPVDERMYDLEPSMYTIDGAELLACRNATVGTIDEQVMACLEGFALARENPSKAVVGVWTRTKIKPTRVTDFYGVRMSEEQGKNMDDYFDKHVILVLGASPTPAVTECLAGLFGLCQNGGIKSVSKLCEGHILRERELGNLYTYGTIPDDKTFIGNKGYYPNDNFHGRYHSLPANDIPELVKGTDFQRPNPKIKRKLSFIIDHPIAHVQNQNMIMEQWDTIETIQHGFPQQIMNIYTPEGRKILSDAGWDPGHVIAFDGIPQFNPSKTGAFDWNQKTLMSEEKFIANNGYEGWTKDYGTKCRGPLPPHSMLKKVNDLARRGYKDAGLDLKFYGRTWEFANQFWFAVKGWTPSKGLDCTHAKQNGTGLSCVHKYFLQLMVDDHYESMEGGQR